jgi:hypothetical protein
MPGLECQLSREWTLVVVQDKSRRTKTGTSKGGHDRDFSKCQFVPKMTKTSWKSLYNECPWYVNQCLWWWPRVIFEKTLHARFSSGCPWHHACDRVSSTVVLRNSALVFFETCSVLFTVRHELSQETRVDEWWYYVTRIYGIFST